MVTNKKSKQTDVRADGKLTLPQYAKRLGLDEGLVKFFCWLHDSPTTIRSYLNHKENSELCILKIENYTDTGLNLAVEDFEFEVPKQTFISLKTVHIHNLHGDSPPVDERFQSFVNEDVLSDKGELKEKQEKTV